MKSVLKVFSVLMIILAVLSVYGWMVNQIGTKNKDFGFLTKPIKFMYSYPDLFEQSVEEVNALPQTFIPTPADFQGINELDEDLMVLSTYSDTSESRSIVLRNLRTDSIHNKWTFEHPKKVAWKEVERILNPILCPDGSLIYNFDYKRYPGLFKVGPSGDIIWKSDTLVVHHGINIDSEGDVWASTQLPGSEATGKYSLNGSEKFFNDYTITEISGETGEILFHKSITEILMENGLGNYLFKSVSILDPIHLNDVQPALSTTKYWEKGDVFISNRNMHMIMHYRPSTNELLKILEGPFIHQHDIDILNDSALVLFNNNNYTGVYGNGKPAHNIENRAVDAGDFYSNIVRYDFSDDSWSFVGEELFAREKIYTENEGLVEFIDEDTYLVEEQNSGILWVIRNDTVIYKDVFDSQHDGHHHLPNWTRIVSP